MYGKRWEDFEKSEKGKWKRENKLKRKGVL